MHVLGMGIVGIRLYARILTSDAAKPDELADNLVDEINCYMPRATPSEQQLLFQLACEIHEAFGDAFERVDDLSYRFQALDLVNGLLSKARELRQLGL
ncbi:hypothetical protein [Chitiniphilus eburneus]|uniref:Uncharacterized protein n=1 Tax=Chitiniphilus eburneus TaxID=2571148 RepID=A0A4U0PG90_9NEIS|nr:hypothetical protein [Chitiniphilus eburneus]TJZ66660.1 hypothetical protein FAZ21_17160 [Chitiniphilus eburneus]